MRIEEIDMEDIEDCKINFDERGRDLILCCKDKNGKDVNVNCEYPTNIMVAIFGELHNAENQIKLSKYIQSQKELPECLMTIYNKLPNDLGKTMIMFYSENNTIREISNKLNITPNKVIEHLALALRKMRNPIYAKYLYKFMPQIDDLDDLKI